MSKLVSSCPQELSFSSSATFTLSTAAFGVVSLGFSLLIWTVIHLPLLLGTASLYVTLVTFYNLMTIPTISQFPTRICYFYKDLLRQNFLSVAVKSGLAISSNFFSVPFLSTTTSQTYVSLFFNWSTHQQLYAGKQQFLDYKYLVNLLEKYLTKTLRTCFSIYHLKKRYYIWILAC